MVAVIAGGSLGLERSSAWVLGSRGQSGQAGLGVVGENVYVNATTGNLVIQRTDEILLGRGPDSVIGRTYNSLGLLDGDNNDSWRTNVHRTITENATTNAVTRTNWDGSQDVYDLVSTSGNVTTYRFKGDGDAWDDLVKTVDQGTGVATWTWTNGNTRVTETYENGTTASGVTTWRLTKMTDLDLNQVTYEYTGGLVTKVTTAGGDYTLLSYTGNDLTQVSTHLASGSTLTRVRYTYETYQTGSPPTNAQRLKTVTVDLSPEDNTASAGSIYTTTYTYDGDSTRIASIAHTDPSLADPMVLLQVTYTQVNGIHRVASFTQMAASGEARTTTLSYDTTTLPNHTVTTVADPHGAKTVFTSNQAGQLVKLETSPQTGGSGGTPAPTTPPAGYVLITGSETDNDVLNGNVNSAVNEAIQGLGGNDTLDGKDGNDWLQGGSGTDNLRGSAGNDILIGAGGEDRLYGGAGGDTYVFEVGGITDLIKINEFKRVDGDKLDFSAFPGLTFADLTIQVVSYVVSGVTYYDTLIKVPGQANEVVRLERYSAGLLESDFIFGPSADAAVNRVLQFEYDADGNVTKLTENGFATSYQYDGDNCVLEQNDLGLTIRRTYGANNELLRETRYLVADPDGYNTGATASAPLTTRYVYDAGNHLRFVVSGEGMVTEFQYNGFGQVASSFRYAGQRYAVSGLAETAQIALADLVSWAGGLNRSTAERTDTAYDYRGNIASVTTYERLLSTGAVDTTGASTKLLYTYDQAGNLLQRQLDGKPEVEVFAYDGFNRLKSSTDFNGRTTTIAFNDNLLTTTVTVADGLQKISTYNRLGELIAYKELASGDLDPPITTYTYDKLGRLRRVTDPTGISTYALYDKLGRKVADIQSDGSMVEYGYNADGELLWTVAYKSLLSPTLLGHLEADVTGNLYDVAHYRPSNPNAADIWEWRVYDAAHRLVQTIDGVGAVTSFAYDGASRLVSTTAHSETLASLVAGFKTTPPLTAIAVAANAADRVSRNFYDADGRLVGSLDAEGYLSQIVYDAAGRQIETIGYATVVPQAHRAAGDFAQLVTDVTASPNAADIHAYAVYDGRGDLRVTIGGEGEVTRYDYTPLGDVQTITRGQKLTPTELTALRTTPPTLTPPAAQAGTVFEVTAYERDLYGLVLVETRTLSDQRTEKTTYKYDALYRLTAVTTGILAALPGTPPAPAVPPVGYDQYLTGDASANTIDGGSNRDVIQGLGGNDVLKGNDGDDWVSGSTGVDNMFGGNGADILLGNAGNDRLNGGAGADIYVFAPGGGADIISAGQFSQSQGDKLDLSAFGDASQYKLIEQVGADTVITFADQSSVKIEGFTATLLTEQDFIYARPPGWAEPARTLTKRYDGYGRLIGELTGEGSAALAALGLTPTQAQVDAVYAAWGVAYTYDKAGRLTSRVDPDGASGPGYLTRYFYNTDGQLTHAINALGEVVEYRYDTFGRRTDVVAYGNRLAPEVLAGLPLGGFASGLGTAISNLASATADSQTSMTYNVTGTVATATDAVGATTSYAYDSFRQLTSQQSPISANDSVTTAFTYDRRGLLRTTAINPAGLNLVSESVYDAFGRVIQSKDTKEVSRFAVYDRSGQVIQTTDSFGKTQTYEYDGRGNTVKTIDRNGVATTVKYTAFNRQIEVTDGNGNKTLTSYGANGQTVEIRDAAGRTTTYSYDRNGNLKTAVDGVAQQVTNSYDKAGRLVESLDGRRVKSTFTYDAASRMVTQTLDPGTPPANLNLTTQFVYDAKGQQVRIIDAEQRVTEITFDRNGRQTKVVQDPAGLALTTTYAYDQRGRVVTVTEAADTPADARVTTHTYDKADRLIKTQVDPTGLNLTTDFTYDKAGNVVARKDGNGKLTRFIYDSENRLTWTVNDAGDVTYTAYDFEGRVTMQRGYTARLAEGAATAMTGLETSVSVTASANDRVTHYVHDAGGRLRFVIDASGRPVEYRYDGSDNVIRTITYAGSLPVAASYAYQDVLTQLGTSGLSALTSNRTSRAVFDAAGRQAFSIDMLGQVTAFIYDASGNLLHVREHATLYTASADATADAMVAWSESNTTTNDRISRAAFDAAGRQTFAVDALGGVTRRTYDKVGNVTAETRFSQTYGVAGLLSDGVLATWAGTNGAPADRVTRSVYDAANRQVYAIDAVGAVIQVGYDKASRVVAEARHAVAYTGSDYTIAGLSAYVLTDPAAVLTTYDYDAGGRLIEMIDAVGVHTTYQLNGESQVTQTTIAGGTTDAATTSRTYDAAGRLKTTNLGVGTADLATTTYEYDGLGQVVRVTRGATETLNTYDAVGRVVSAKVLLEVVDNVPKYAETISQYDALGNLVAVTDPRGNVGYFYYDAAGRLTLQVDAEGYATQTEYSLGGQVSKVTRYLQKSTNAYSATVLPDLATSLTYKAITSFTWDKLDRLTGTTDAMNGAETYQLDIFGDRTTVTTKGGLVTTNVYDKRGLLLSETLQTAAYRADGTLQASSVTNAFTYDIRGNRLSMTEAQGLTEERVTEYQYDNLDRLTRTLGESVSYVNDDLAAAPVSGRPEEKIVYDRRGNVIETTNQAGAVTRFYYDDLDRKIGELGPTGLLSRWTYDVSNNVLTERRYGDAKAMTGNPGGTPPLPVNANNYRETAFKYDANNRLIESRIVGVKTGEIVAGAYVVSTSDIVSTRTYDALGKVVRETDARGNSSYFYYDKTGRRIASVDAERYLVFYTLDSEGNVTTEERFANRVAAATVSSDPAALRTEVLSGTGNRQTNFTYDKMGRRLTETRLSVLSGTVSTAGVLSMISAVSSTVTYQYNALGLVTRKVEATGDATDFTYDTAGRLTAQTGPAFLPHDSTTTTVQQKVESAYDGLGNLVRTTLRDSLVTSASDRITQYKYGAGGRLDSIVDAMGFERFYAYDLGGRVLRETYTLTQADGAPVKEAAVYRYDAKGNVVFQAMATKLTDPANSPWVWGDQTGVRYNVYGEITGRGIKSTAQSQFTYQETTDYDTAGRIWRSNAGDGVARVYLYDKVGNATLNIATSGSVDLSTKTQDEALALVSTNGVVGSAAVSAAVVTFSIFDARGQAIETREPFRELSVNAQGQKVTDTPIYLRSYNAFGEVIQETDARGAVTDFAYNTMGKLTRRTSAQVNYTTEANVTRSYRAAQDYYYDKSGRLIAIRDATNALDAADVSGDHANDAYNSFDATDKLTRRVLLAGTGYGGSEALVAAEFHADDGVIRTGYDVFGNARTITDELNHVEQRQYDKLGRLTALIRPSRAATSTPNAGEAVAGLQENYIYDELGRRIGHWNSQLGSSVVEKTDYDGQGRVVRTVDYGGHATEYIYSWVNDLATTGLQTFGGWSKRTLDATSHESIQKTDYFGRTVGRTDLGNRVYSFTYDKAGRLVSQGSTQANTNQTFSYYNTGKIASVNDISGPKTGYGTSNLSSKYSYDLAGNRLTETYAGTVWDYILDQELQVMFLEQRTVSYQNSTATYDALNRLSTFIDKDAGGQDQANVSYKYDANSNVRNVYAVYDDVEGVQQQAQNYWYKYDVMNRAVLTMGTLNGSSIEIGNVGTELTYNLAGQRTSALTRYDAVEYDDSSGTVVTLEYRGYKREDFSYTEDGYLASVRLREGSINPNTYQIYRPSSEPGWLLAEYARDSMGRTTRYYEYDEGYATPEYQRFLTYNNASQVTAEIIDRYEGTDHFVATTVNHYNAIGDGSYNGQYAGALVHSKTTNTKNGSQRDPTEFWIGYEWWDSARQKTMTYDANASTNSNNSNWVSTYYYDANSHLSFVNIKDGRPRTISYITDIAGQVLERREVEQASGTGPINKSYYFDGLRIGEVTNAGPLEFDYSTSINKRFAGLAGPFRYGESTYADFDQSYEPISPSSAAGTDGVYTVQDGDTLQSIALGAWGDASLWYLIADANGLTGSEVLVGGTTLTIPSNVVNIHNSSDTFRVYDPNKAIGDTAPTQVAPPAADKGCGMIGMIIVMVVAIIVAWYVAPYAIAGMSNMMAGTTLTGAQVSAAMAAGTLTTTVSSSAAIVAGGAIAGAAGSIASQAVGMAIGVQDKFSWSAVALAAVAGGMANGLGTVKGLSDAALGGAFAGGAVRGGITNVVTQGVAIATGVQDQFDWAAVATVAIASGLSNWVGQSLAAAGVPIDSAPNRIISGLAGGLAGTATRSVVTGRSFETTLSEDLPGIIANTVGEMITSGIRSQSLSQGASQIGAGVSALGSGLAGTAAEVSAIEVQVAQQINFEHLSGQISTGSEISVPLDVSVAQGGAGFSPGGLLAGDIVVSSGAGDVAGVKVSEDFFANFITQRGNHVLMFSKPIETDYGWVTDGLWNDQFGYYRTVNPQGTQWEYITDVAALDRPHGEVEFVDIRATGSAVGTDPIRPTWDWVPPDTSNYVSDPYFVPLEAALDQGRMRGVLEFSYNRPDSKLKGQLVIDVPGNTLPKGLEFQQRIGPDGSLLVVIENGRKKFYPIEPGGYYKGAGWSARAEGSLTESFNRYRADISKTNPGRYGAYALSFLTGGLGGAEANVIAQKVAGNVIRKEVVIAGVTREMAEASLVAARQDLKAFAEAATATRGSARTVQSLRMNALAEQNAGRRIAELEQKMGSGSHFGIRHGADTTRAQQFQRALDGTLPGGGSSYRPPAASRVFSNRDMLNGLNRATTIYQTTGKAPKFISFGRPVGEGFVNAPGYKTGNMAVPRPVTPSHLEIGWRADRTIYSAFPKNPPPTTRTWRHF